MQRPYELDHRYGPGIHILDDLVAATMLARVRARETVQPELNQLIADLYRFLLWRVVSQEFSHQHCEVTTPMADQLPMGQAQRAVWSGSVLDQRTRAVVVSIARAGTLPSQVAYDFLTRFFGTAVCMDNFSMSRTTDKDQRVTGAAIHGAKNTASVQASHLLIPDPMGASGTTLDNALSYYREHVAGTPVAIIAVHLIVTPEYLKLMKEKWPTVRMYALAVDRGLSDETLLRLVPGERWDEERGLTDHQYIVPGAGGLGERMTNVWV